MDRDQHLSDEPRFRTLETALKQYQYQPDALIEVLHRAQDLFGYLSPEVLSFVARGLRLPPSRVYGVATFYHLFTLRPAGAHRCVVCTGTACFVAGAGRLLPAVERLAGVGAGETTPDRQLSLLTARCIGACGIAPAVVYDGVTAGQQTPEAVVRRVGQWLGVEGVRG
jgi:bidirectional [NiFe] hydrogenase diaphorase subunit